ncbi:eukaryotic translation initiation factor 3 subunit F [Thraustotheca clavata]|uniref:Eukaryotic translation initiation factor 3 subunit F n=1 Tax=Thraustotheca clavata TaxID=74557 RepID=A0A1V9ZQ61_9STRA|nr:eukaryotic translation initiation factor 3 subunit F [Thraustotheca clavata]
MQTGGLLAYPGARTGGGATSPAPPTSLFGGMHVKQSDSQPAPVEAAKPTSLFNGLDLGGSSMPVASTPAPLSLSQLNLTSSTPVEAPPLQKTRAPRPGTFNYLNVAPPVESTPVASMPPVPAPVKKKKKPSFRPGFDRQNSEDTGSQRGDDDDEPRAAPRNGSVLKGLIVHPVEPEAAARMRPSAAPRQATPPRTRPTSSSSASSSDPVAGLLDQLKIVNVGPGATGYSLPPSTHAPSPRVSVPSPRASLTPAEPTVKKLTPRTSSAKSLGIPPATPAPTTPEGRLVQLIRDYDIASKSFRDSMVQLQQEEARLVEKKNLCTRQLAQYNLDLQSVEAQQMQAAADEDFERADALNTTIGSVRHCIMLSQSDLRKGETDLASLLKQREKLVLHHVRTTKGVLHAIQKCEDERESAYNELSKMAKNYKHTELRRFAFEQQRIATELHHVTVNMGHLEGEKNEIEQSIASQCTNEFEAQTRLLSEKEAAEEEIAELEAKLAAAKAKVAAIDAGLKEADAGIQAVRHKFARQLKRLVEREKSILKTKKEIEADDLALSRQQDTFEAKKEEYAQELAHLAKEVLGVQKEVRIAAIMVRLTEEQNQRRELKDERIKKQDVQLLVLRDAAQQAEQQFMLLGHQHDELKKKLQMNRTVIMTAGTNLPQLEAEKKAAAAERNFKEAARLSKDIKQLEKDRSTAEEAIEVIGMEIKDIEERIHKAEDVFKEKNEELINVEKNLELEWLDILYQVHHDLRVAMRQLSKYESEKWSSSNGEVDFREVALTLVQMEFNAITQEIETLEDKYNLEPHVIELAPEVPEKELTLLVEEEEQEEESVQKEDEVIASPAAKQINLMPKASPVKSSVESVGDFTTSEAIKEKISLIEQQIDEATENEDYELAARLDEELEEWNARLKLVETKEDKLKEKLDANDMHKQVEALQRKIEHLAEQIENATEEEEYELAAALDEELIAAQTRKTDLQLQLANLPNDEDIPQRMSSHSLHLVEDNSDAEEDDDDSAVKEESQDEADVDTAEELLPTTEKFAISTEAVSPQVIAVQSIETAEEPVAAPVFIPIAPSPVAVAVDTPQAEAKEDNEPVVIPTESPAPLPSLFGGLSIGSSVSSTPAVGGSLFGGLQLNSESTPAAPSGSLFGSLPLGTTSEPTSLFGGLTVAPSVDESKQDTEESLLGGDYVMDSPSIENNEDEDDIENDEYQTQETPISAHQEIPLSPMALSDDLTIDTYEEQESSPTQHQELPLVEESIAEPIVIESTAMESKVSIEEITPVVVAIPEQETTIPTNFEVKHDDALIDEELIEKPAEEIAVHHDIQVNSPTLLVEKMTENPALIPTESIEKPLAEALVHDDLNKQPLESPVHRELIEKPQEAAPLSLDLNKQPLESPVHQELIEKPQEAAPLSLFGGLSIEPTKQEHSDLNKQPLESPVVHQELLEKPKEATPLSLFGGLSIEPAKQEPIQAPLSLFGGLNVAPSQPPALSTPLSLFGGLNVSSSTSPEKSLFENEWPISIDHLELMSLVLNTEGVSLVHVHPVVVFQVLDRFLRRAEDQKRVIGTLLGLVDAEHGVVTITNSFPVPHLEKGDEVAVGKDYHRQMLLLHQRVNPNEVVVGWYATSSDSEPINENSCLIHDFYSSECPSPVHVVVNTSLASDSLNLMAFTSSALQVADVALANQFKQVKVETKTYEAEAIALNLMAKRSTEATTLPSDLEALEMAIERLHELLAKSAEYVGNVIAGKEVANPKLGRELAEAVASIPPMRSDLFDQIFNNGMQDLLMVSYLSSLTQAQLSIAEKLISA